MLTREEEGETVGLAVHVGESLASFAATLLASDFEAAARRVGHLFHILAAWCAKQLFLRDIATSPLVFDLVVILFK
jgi:hypothetical protein